MKRRSKILIGVILALVIGWPLLLMISHKNVRDKVAAYKQELRAKGEKLTFAELAPSPSKKTPNGASALTNLVNYLEPSMDVPPMMVMIAPGIARIGHTNISAELMSSYTSNVQRTAELRTILTNAAVLDFNVDYSNFSAFHLRSLNNADQLITATAMQAIYNRDHTEARQDLFMIADIVRLFDNEPVVMSQMLRYKMMRTATAATWEGLQENEWTDAQLKELQSKWEATDLLSLLESFITMERAGSVETLSAARASPKTLDYAYYGPGGDWTENVRRKLQTLYDRYPRTWMWKSSWSYEQELYFLQFITIAVETSRKIKATEALVLALNEFRSQATGINKIYQSDSGHFVLGVESVRYWAKYFTKLAEAETARRLLVTVLALKRYHLQHGDYPASLNELVPNYLKQIPKDFMDGKLLRYRLKPGGDFLLYSVGEDGEDNGGDPSPVEKVEDGELDNWLNARDIVWPRAATAAEIEKFEGHSQDGTNAPAK